MNFGRCSLCIFNAGFLIFLCAPTAWADLIVAGPGATGRSEFGGNLHLGTTLQMEIGGTLPVAQYDQLYAASLFLDKTNPATQLQVILINGFVPELDDSFDLLDWDTLSSEFGSLDLPPLPDSLAWDVSQLYATGVLSVTFVPEPGSAGLFLSAILGASLAWKWNTRRSKAIEELAS